jgi:hypothetical protein
MVGGKVHPRIVPSDADRGETGKANRQSSSLACHN